MNPENLANFRRYGCYHVACGRVLFNRHTAGLEDAAMDHPPSGIEPVRHVIQGAQAYAHAKGLADPHEGIDYHAVRTHRDLLKDLAHHYDRLPNDDPAAHKHFDAMRDEVGQQYHHLTHNMGIKVEVRDQDPYPDVHALRHDVENNHRIQVMGTHATGGHPYFSNSENDRFRAVHDVFGHLGTGRDFDRHGEEAAFQAHARMFTEHARPALTSETRGQNGSLIVNDRFGPQKIGVLPQRLWHPGLASSATLMDDYRVERDAQDRRAERETGGYRRETDSYYGRDGEGDAVERRVNLKDYLKQHRQPREEEEPIADREWWRGHEIGQRHGINPESADLGELNHGYAHSLHPEQFYAGYKHGWENADLAKSAGNTQSAPNQVTSQQTAGSEHGRNGAVEQRIAVHHGFSSPEGIDYVLGGMPKLVHLGHVSGNSIDVLHCPFCGSGALVARSDGTVECNFCTSVFTVQVQPQYAAFPQTAEGMPYEWPGQPDPSTVIGGAPAPGGIPGEEDPDAAPGEDDGNPFADGAADDAGEEEGGAEEDSGPPAEDDDDDAPAGPGKAQVGGKDAPPFIKKKSYRTAAGALLSEEDYLRHLAIDHARDRGKVARLVRESR